MANKNVWGTCEAGYVQMYRSAAERCEKGDREKDDRMMGEGDLGLVRESEGIASNSDLDL